MKEQVTLSIDLGSSAFKLILFSSSRGQLHCSETPFETQYLGDKVEHKATEIWEKLQNQLSLLLDQLDSKDLPQYLSISTQRESVVAWDKATLEPLSPIISWQDRRTDDYISSLDREILQSIRSKTGLWISSYCSAPKFRYLIKEIIPDLTTDWLWGTLDCWLIYLLSKGKYYVTDYVSASRTALLNLRDLKWDKELCSFFGLPMEKFPSFCENDQEIGSIQLFGKYHLVLKGVVGDQQGALYATYRLRKEKEKLPISLVYGTGAFLLQLLSSNKSFEEIYSSLPENSPLSISLAWVLKNQPSYALELGISNSGKALEWLLNLLKIKPKDLDNLLDPKNVKWESLPYSVPTLSSKFLLSSPESYLASISNLGYETKERELILSFLESMSYSVRVSTELLSFDKNKNYIVVGGGLSKNNFFLELQSSCLDCPLTIYQTEHLSGLGSAFLTFSESIKIFNLEHRLISPKKEHLVSLNKRFLGWKAKLEQCQIT